MAVPTALDLIKPALQHIVVQGSEAALEPAEYQDTIAALNNMMAAYEARGVDLNWTEVISVSQKIYIDPGSFEAISALLAIKIAPQFDATPSPELHLMAKEGKDTLYILGQTITETSEPADLPVGSGNEAYQTRRFYGPSS